MYALNSTKLHILDNKWSDVGNLKPGCCDEIKKTGWPVTSGATLVASVSFTFKLVFYIHSFCDQKIAKKI